jgi:lipopolysaccharide transport system ATP-binding protein
MSDPIISVENLSKKYRLGQIGTGTLSNDMKVWWALKRGLPNPMLKIGQEDHGNRKDGEIWALRGVNFTVQPGEVLGIIGRNGAGKSTLLKILSRVTAPTEGRVKVRGRIASLLEVGTGFHPELTGRENIYLNGAILGMTKQEIDRKFDEIVDFAEIEQFIETPVKRYSSGMYVRLAFSVAAHLESEILLVDEVLAVGDLEFQKKCIGKMGDIASEEGRTVLFVSHNMVSVRRLCERGILLNAGVIETMGPIDDTLNQYMSIKEKTQLQDLASRTDRSGNGKLRFTSIDVLDESKIKYNVKVGSPTSILIKYKGTAPLRNVAFPSTLSTSMAND